MNSEVGGGAADFTRNIKQNETKESVSDTGFYTVEVDTWNADFCTVKVGIRAADFDFKYAQYFCFS